MRTSEQPDFVHTFCDIAAQFTEHNIEEAQGVMWDDNKESKEELLKFLSDQMSASSKKKFYKRVLDQ